MNIFIHHERKIGHQHNKKKQAWDTAATHQQRIKFDVVILHCVFLWSLDSMHRYMGSSQLWQHQKVKPCVYIYKEYIDYTACICISQFLNFSAIGCRLEVIWTLLASLVGTFIWDRLMALTSVATHGQRCCWTLDVFYPSLSILIINDRRYPYLYRFEQIAMNSPQALVLTQYYI